MKKGYLLHSNEKSPEGNIYADKSALILAWLLQEGIKKDSLVLRDVALEVGVSIGLVQRVFNILIQKGLLQTKGLRTAKRFLFNKPKPLLEGWLENYSIVKKCKMTTYCSSLTGKQEFFAALKQAKLDQQVILALHSAAEAYGYKNTNLETLELYVLDPSIKEELERALQLKPQERGYEILLAEPYYKSLIKESRKDSKDIGICPLLLTFLDLYHFPLRGQEQAEFIAERAPEIKHLYRLNK